jgi:hypothetical protein
LLSEKPIGVDAVATLRESGIHELLFGSNPIGDGIF